MTIHTPVSTDRNPDHPAHRAFVDRWSPRGFSDEPIRVATLQTFFEAARWAPSAYNSQPWRFVYALRGDAAFEQFLAPLIEFNRGWAKHAAAIVYLLSKKDFTPPGKSEPAFARTHSLLEREKPSGRAPIADFVAHGLFTDRLGA